MKKTILILAGAAAVAAALPTASFAGGPAVGFSISIGAPAYFPPPPVAYYPPPALYYLPPPVAFYPRPFVYAPPTVVFRAGSYSGWGYRNPGYGYGYRGQGAYGHGYGHGGYRARY